MVLTGAVFDYSFFIFGYYCFDDDCGLELIGFVLLQAELDAAPAPVDDEEVGEEVVEEDVEEEEEGEEDDVGEDEEGVEDDEEGVDGPEGDSGGGPGDWSKMFNVHGEVAVILWRGGVDTPCAHEKPVSGHLSDHL